MAAQHSLKVLVLVQVQTGGQKILDEYIVDNIKYTVTAKGIYMQALIKK